MRRNSFAEAGPKIASPILDPDKDGIATIIEFLVGTNPIQFNQTSEAIKVNPFNLNGARKIEVEFKRRIDDVKIEGHLWGSYDMKNWQRLDDSNPIYEEYGNQGENPIYEDVTGTITLPLGIEPFFLRYQATDLF